MQDGDYSKGFMFPNCIRRSKTTRAIQYNPFSAPTSG
jgi:hypothetical protein